MNNDLCLCVGFFILFIVKLLFMLVVGLWVKYKLGIGFK